MPGTTRVLGTTAIAALLVLTLGNCASKGPSTKDEVCQNYSTLGHRILGANGIFDNAVFNSAGDLADAAGRYPGPANLSGDAERLQKIADSDSTNGAALMDATTNVAALCGHPLGLN